MYSVNSYLVINKITGNCVLIDAPGGIDTVKEFLSANKYNLNYVILTHGHFDHMQGLEDLDCPFFISEVEKEFLSDTELNLSCFFDPLIIKKPANFIGDKDVLSLDEDKIEIIPTPGHTPGSVSCLIGGFLFTGDALFRGSVGRTDFTYASHEDLMRSLNERILPLKNRVKTVFPGHGPSTDMSTEIRTNPFLSKCGNT